jgi:hypothetical protein
MQVCGDAGVPLRRRCVAHDEVDVDVQHLHGLIASDVPGIGLQEAV